MRDKRVTLIAPSNAFIHGSNYRFRPGKSHPGPIKWERGLGTKAWRLNIWFLKLT